MSALWKTRFFRTVLPGRTGSHKLRDYLPPTCDRHMHFNSWHTLHHPRLCKTPNWWAVLSAVSLNGKDNTSSPKLPLQHLGRFHGAGRSMKIPCNKNNASVFPIIDNDHLILLKNIFFPQLTFLSKMSDDEEQTGIFIFLLARSPVRDM